MKNYIASCLLFALAIVLGCGDNIQNPTPTTSSDAPPGLKAFSLNNASVQLQWSAAFASSDSTYQGYLAQVGTTRDTLSRSTLTFVADSLPLGASLFSVYSMRQNGTLSNPATIRWAPAERFGTPFNVFERNNAVAVARPDGFDAGTSSLPPSVFAIDSGALSIGTNLDLFFNGDSALTHQSLSIWSANLLVGSYNHTLFSTQTDAAASLDFPLAAFPVENTFIKDSIAAIDNTIYYVKVVGDPGQFNYARIHVHITQAYPNRIIQVRVSLQRSAGLQFAFSPDLDYRRHLPLFALISLLKG